MPTAEMMIVNEDSSQAGGHTLDAGSSVSTFAEGQAASPLVLRRDQLYYWSAVWQAGEAESLEDLASGQVEQFHDSESVMRWLFSSDD
jgi:hypothetical protein